ncbi:MAG TPA: alpha/beta hydrolase [Dehalococcoidia bacterium]|jgi:pimeloyl-ACP methyl ester carboxylesterase|nr:alpha/beta hydrolase [Dehalococcoidia bacterium]
MNRADIDGITLEYEVQGSGEPVVFIHGALMGDTYRPLMAEAALKSYRFIGYNRRGYAGSSPPGGALSVASHAADCLALLRKLDAVPAHVVGHSSGAVIGIQLALDAPDAVRSLTLLEPALLDVPSGGALFELLGPSVGIHEAGDKAEAVDSFLRAVCGKDYRRVVDTRLPGTLDQAAADADAFFTNEFPAVGEWAFTRENAARIKRPVLSVMGANTDAAIGLPTYSEIHARVLEWFPNAKPFVLPRAAHLLQVENPHDMAEALATFIESN